MNEKLKCTRQEKYFSEYETDHGKYTICTCYIGKRERYSVFFNQELLGIEDEKKLAKQIIAKHWRELSEHKD